MTELRNYVDSSVEKVYKKMIQKQTLDYVLSMKNKYSTYPNIKMSIWKAIEKLNNIVDESDPDTEHPQIVHACQTGAFISYVYLEKGSNKLNNNIKIKELFSKKEWNDLPICIKEDYERYCNLDIYYGYIKEWDWLPLIGFIHDLGKVLVLPEFGELEQWSVVGDTFPVGCKYTNKNLYYKKKYHKSNPDYIKYNCFNGIYELNCGFDNIHMSYGHDEYLSSVLKKNNTKLPNEAIYLIRYHSFYAWHNPKNSSIRGYTNLASMYDWKMLPLLKAFQKADLYSKVEKKPNIKEVKKIFGPLIKKYIGDEYLIW